MGLVTALRTLTILPVPGRDAERLSSALPWFPIVGGLLGLALYGLARGVEVLAGGNWPGGAAVVVLAAGALLTGGLHLDGLADWADGFGGGRDREKTLAIMKDSHIGAFGVVALTLILVARWAALARVIELGLGAWIVVALIAARAVQVELAASLPYARPEGGTAAGFVEGAGGRHRVLSMLVALPLAAAACGPAGAVGVLVALIIGKAFGLWCRRRVGGITGDLLGAASEISETAVLFLAALGGERLAGFTGWSWLLRQ